MRALQFRRQELRYAAAAVGSRLFGSDGAKLGPLRLADLDPLPLPTPDWVRIRPRLTGICGSDLATVAGESARYFEPYISFPFVLGHEIVADDASGGRVVLEPVLGHAARGLARPGGVDAPGDGHDYGHLVRGDLDEGIQTGFCASTGGGWATELVAHPSQLHPVPAALSDEDAVLVEPLAVAVHAALRATVPTGGTVAVIGAGTMGLLSVAALRRFHPDCHIIVGAKYPHQEEWATTLGADLVVRPEALRRAVRRTVGCLMVGDDLSGGAEVTVDTLGTGASIREAIGLTRPRGRVVLVGMPATVRLELTALWHRETELVGSYCYCTEHLPDGERRNSFNLALDMAAELRLGGLVSAAYPLARYTDAIAHAANAGTRQAVKVCFDLRGEKHR